LKAAQWFVAGIFLLAVVGLGASLVHNPFGLLKTIAVIAVLAAVLAVGVRFLLNRGITRSNQEQKAFLKAARKSKKRLKKRNTNVHAVHHAVKFNKRPLRKKSNVQLTVIEGKKSKKRNRVVY
jgi:hypothetical protein